MRKNTYLRAISCLLITICMLFVIFSACTETDGDKTNEPSTAEPSADVYNNPTEKATIVPITLAPLLLPTPPAEITHDVEMLNVFFDTPSKVEGKTNGELIFRNYESGNPYSWYVYNNPGHYELYDIEEFIFWAVDDGSRRNYSGDVQEIATRFLKDEQILNCSGTLLLDGLEYLKSIDLCNFSADELIIESCGKLEYVSMFIDLEKSNHFFEKVYINAHIGSSDIYPCAKEFRLVVPAPEWKRDFDITALADGDGIVSVNLEYDTHYPNVVIYAEAAGGSHFVGWYDEEGHLVSEDEEFMLTEWDQFELFDEVATYTAKFEKD